MPRFLSLLLILGAFSSLDAQANEKRVTVRLLAFSRVEGIRSLHMASRGGEVFTKKPVNLPLHELSKPVQVTSRKLEFYEATAQEPSDRDPAQLKKNKRKALAPPRKVGSVTLPSTGSHFLLVFMPAAKGKDVPLVIQANVLPANLF